MTVPHCPKCGNVRNGWFNEPDRVTYVAAKSGKPEHIKRKCSRCGYKSEEACLGVTVPPEQGDE